MGGGLEEGQTDWKRLEALTDQDIAQAIAADPDTFEARPEWLDRAVIVRPAVRKQRLTIRFDEDVVAWFKAQGQGYQTMMNAVLRRYVEAQRGKSPER